jgi:hypothetical protein
MDLMDNFNCMQYPYYDNYRLPSGWEEAYNNEYNSLGQQIIMSKEEQRLLRVEILKRKDEIDLLNQELEEAYLEMDNLGEMRCYYETNFKDYL